MEEICCVYSSGAENWLLRNCWVTVRASLGIAMLSCCPIYLLTLFFAPILTVMNFGNSQWRKLSGKRIGFCAWRDLNPAYDTGFNKSLLVANMLVCSYSWEQKVKLQLCQARGRGRTPGNGKFLPECRCCSQLWTFVPVVLLDSVSSMRAISCWSRSMFMRARRRFLGEELQRQWKQIHIRNRLDSWILANWKITG